jgi:seryl-tRNA synthetase
MLTLKVIQENKQEVIQRLKIKNFDATKIVESIQKIDEDRKKTQKEQDDILAQINSISLHLFFRKPPRLGISPTNPSFVEHRTWPFGR